MCLGREQCRPKDISRGYRFTALRSKKISNPLGMAVLSTYEEFRRVKEKYPGLHIDANVYTSNEEALVELSLFSQYRFVVDEDGDVVIEGQGTKKPGYPPCHFPMSPIVNMRMQARRRFGVHLNFEPSEETSTSRHTSVDYIFHGIPYFNTRTVLFGVEYHYDIPAQQGKELILEVTARMSWKITNDPINNTVIYSNLFHEMSFNETHGFRSTPFQVNTVDKPFDITVKSSSKAKSRGFFHRFMKRLWGD